MKGLALVIMAAGASSRLGRDKLMERIGGKPLYIRAFDAVPEGVFSRVVTVSGSAEILSCASGRGFIPVENRDPGAGPALTVRLGLEAAGDAGGVMFMVADQPLLKKESVAALAAHFLARPSMICALGAGGRRGNPVIFPRRFLPELMRLPGGKGGGAAVAAHPDALSIFEAGDPFELLDADDEASLLEIRRIAGE